MNTAQALCPLHACGRQLFSKTFPVLSNLLSCSQFPVASRNLQVNRFPFGAANLSHSLLQKLNSPEIRSFVV